MKLYTPKEVLEIARMFHAKTIVADGVSYKVPERKEEKNEDQ